MVVQGLGQAQVAGQGLSAAEAAHGAGLASGSNGVAPAEGWHG